ncbi:DNA topoisomerase [Tabrizicola sp. M-4]|uniref:DNA topoisomerase n=1 Tax=Tabrizicola sp. M-4 TaxID=3055847 RepID=UPI003DAA2625
MNMSRAATLKLAAPGAKPMSVGRVQTPVPAMIVNVERKIKNFKPEDYFELSALVKTQSGSVKMRFAPPPEQRILDRAKAEGLRQKAEGARGPLSVKTEAKKQAPPPREDQTARAAVLQRKRRYRQRRPKPSVHPPMMNPSAQTNRRPPSSRSCSPRKPMTAAIPETPSLTSRCSDQGLGLIRKESPDTDRWPGLRTRSTERPHPKT